MWDEPSANFVRAMPQRAAAQPVAGLSTYDRHYIVPAPHTPRRKILVSAGSDPAV